MFGATPIGSEPRGQLPAVVPPQFAAPAPVSGHWPIRCIALAVHLVTAVKLSLRRSTGPDGRLRLSRWNDVAHAVRMGQPECRGRSIQRSTKRSVSIGHPDGMGCDFTLSITSSSPVCTARLRRSSHGIRRMRQVSS